VGIVQRQALKGTIYAYAGVFIGFLTSGLLLPRLFSTEENGIIKLLIAYSGLLGQFFSLGFPAVSARLFPQFRNNETKHNGFLGLNLLVALAGTILLIAFYFILKPIIIAKGAESSPEFENYIYLLLPLSCAVLFFYIIEGCFTAIYNATASIITKDFIQRILILLFIGLFFLDVIDFKQFAVFYTISLISPTVIMYIWLHFTHEFNYKLHLNFIDKSLAKNMALTSLFGILASFSSIIILQLDSIMISTMIGLSATGIYSITFYFGTLIKIPSRGLLKISIPIVANAWKTNDIGKIGELYRQTSISQYIVAMFIFGGIWLNIDNVFKILPETYLEGKYVIFFISLANFIDMSTGITAVIISTSNRYKVLTYFMLVLMVLVLVTNLIFIPISGIVGAAYASALSMAVFNALQIAHIYYHYKILPFTIKHLYATVIGILSYLIATSIPTVEFGFIYDIAIRSTIFTFLFIIPIYVFKIMPELNNLADKYIINKLKRN